MGLRKAQQSQPSKLKSPVPSPAPEDIVPEGKSIPMESVEYKQPLDVMSEDNQEMAASREPSSMTPEQAAESVFGSARAPSPSPQPSPQPSGPVFNPDAAAAEKFAIDFEKNEEADLWPRVLASLGVTEDQKIQIYKAHYGKNNVLVDENGKIKVRKPGAPSFVPADNEMVTNLKDILGDGAGFALRAVMQQAFEYMSQYGGAAAGTAIGGIGGGATAPATGGLSVAAGPLTGLIGGYAAGTVGGLVASPGFADYASSKAAELAGADPAQIEIRDKFVDGLINLGTAGAFKFAGGSLKRLAAEYPVNRIKALAGINKTIEKFVAGFDSELKYISRAKTGEEVGSVLQKMNKSLGDSVGAINEAAYRQAAERAKRGIMDRQPVTNALAKARELIETRAGSLDPIDRSPYPFGDPNGDKILADLDNFIQQFEGPGFAGSGKMFDLVTATKNFQEKAKFDKKTALSAEIRNVYEDFAAALAKDRNEAFERLLSGTKDQKLLDALPYKAYSDFQTQIGKLVSEYEDAKSPELFANALIQKDNSKQFLNLVGVLGKDHPQMVGQIKATWLTKVMNDARLSKGGVIDPNAFVKELDSYGDELVNAAVGKETRAKLDLVSRAWSKINKKGIVSPEEELLIKKSLSTAMNEFSYGGVIPRFFGQMVFNRLSSNAKAIDYIANEGWYAAVNALPLDKQEAALLGREAFIATIGGAKKVTMPNGIVRYVIPPPTKTKVATGVARAGLVQSVTSGKNTGSVLGPKEDEEQ
jgi:hypothetical protein